MRISKKSSYCNLIIKKLLFLLGFVFCITRIFGQGSDTVLNQFEGPYVEYRGNFAYVQFLDTKNQPVLDSFSVKDKDKHPLAVKFSNHGGWDFSVVLQQELRNEPDSWGQVDRIIAFSDIEGEFDAFRSLLIANSVMDSSYNWIFGKGHLVICGDLFDRGEDIAAELWLLYKLEGDASRQGGYVHTLLGNHDIMNLSGDFRYVQPKYIKRAAQMKLGYKDLYSQDSELGRWLRTKNIIEKISGNLYLHGGISPKILSLQWSISKINEECRPFYDQALNPEKFKNKDLWSFFDGRNISPFWFRGYFTNPRASQDLVDSTLAFYDVGKIIVGHDIIDSVGSYYQGKVIGIDVNEHAGNAEGLLIEGKKEYRVGLTGEKFPLTNH
jgi:hypothetical protein